MSNKFRRTGQSRFFFVGVGVLLMVLLEFGVFPDRKPVPIDMSGHPAEIAVTAQPPQESGYIVPAPAIVEPFDKPAAPPTGIMGPHGPVLVFEDEDSAVVKTEAEEVVPMWRRNAVQAPPVPAGAARVVVIIDDLGVDRKRSREILDLPGPLTAAFLPYADDVAPMVEDARGRGHEIIIHMPMEPTDPKLDMGPIALRTTMDGAAFDSMLQKAMESFGGYVGMNNHMGSRLTQDTAAMNRLMEKLSKAGMLFVDSRTIGQSVAERTAAKHGVPHAGRDVFLDHTPTYEAVVGQLAELEAAAKRSGTAIAIGHPKDGTIRALAEWLPTLAGKGIVLVPVSAVVKTDPAMQTVASDIPADEEEAASMPSNDAEAVEVETETPAVMLPAPDEWMVVPLNGTP